MVRPSRLGTLTFGLQIVWGAVLGVSLQARSEALAGPHAVAVYSIVAAVGAGIATLVQVSAGYAADLRRAAVGHRREFLLVGTAMSVPAIFWLYLAPSVTQFAAAFFLLQIAMNVVTAPYQAAIPDYVPAERRGEASSWMSAWQSLGNALGLVTVVVLSARWAVPTVLAAVLLGAFAVTYRHVRSLAALPTSQTAFRVDGTFLTLLVSRGTVNLGFFTLVGYLLFFVRESLGVVGEAVRTQTGLLFLTFTLAAVLGAALASRPSDRYDMRAVATVANVLIVLALATLATSHSLAIAYAAAAIAGTAWGGFFTADWALACALLPRGAMATAMGVWNIATAGPQILAPLLAAPLLLHVDALAPTMGPRATILLAVAEFAFGTALLWLLPATRAVPVEV
ncbi:MAG: MFS transporter [Candidatus Eremiobacteraeota bacterium]|nr:MFS transporter [Candidatus Eremiobacteraeota bacterium]MBV9646888.1 MFS transporter [Candidatus Eremiobacteraeota bacterium]